jgi:hypothetical protein
LDSERIRKADKNGSVDLNGIVIAAEVDRVGGAGPGKLIEIS